MKSHNGTASVFFCMYDSWTERWIFNFDLTLFYKRCKGCIVLTSFKNGHRDNATKSGIIVKMQSIVFSFTCAYYCSCSLLASLYINIHSLSLWFYWDNTSFCIPFYCLLISVLFFRPLHLFSIHNCNVVFIRFTPILFVFPLFPWDFNVTMTGLKPRA